MSTMKDIAQIAKEAVLLAGKEALTYFRKEHIYHHKGEDTNFATEADLAAEKVLFDIVKTTFPGHNFLSEEMGLADKRGEYTWVVDPIDGTFNFSHGQPLWGVECGIFKENKPIMGFLYFPVLNELFWAEKGKGAYLGQEKISVSNLEKLSSSLIAFSTAYPAQRKLQKFPFEKFMRKFDSVTSLSLSTAYDLAAVAGGRVDGFIEEITCIWDIAGGVVLVEEAGGKVSDWSGNPISWEPRKNKYYEIIGANPHLHGLIIEKFNDLI